MNAAREYQVVAVEEPEGGWAVTSPDVATVSVYAGSDHEIEPLAADAIAHALDTPRDSITLRVRKVRLPGHRRQP